MELNDVGLTVYHIESNEYFLVYSTFLPKFLTNLQSVLNASDYFVECVYSKLLSYNATSELVLLTIYCNNHLGLEIINRKQFLTATDLLNPTLFYPKFN